ncbi:MAG: histidine triad nucleotide-binding protein, partial [Catenulispora sp.]|nr:histidine triad nucleotide-binding protein [Catenulispora sp.]
MADGQPVADCLFCKIVAGDVPATVVRETELTFAFKDIKPQAEVHDL